MSGGDVTVGYLKRLSEGTAGLLAGQDKFDVEITGGEVSNVTLTGVTIASLDAPIPVASGGTGSTSASAARTALGVSIGTDVQAFNTALASISGLTTAADKGVYTTSSDTYAVYDLTSYGRSLIGVADETACKALTNLEIGTDVQAHSAVLDATTASFTTAAETKLSGIASGATVNSPDATLLNRANHTGTQTLSTISDAGVLAGLDEIDSSHVAAGSLFTSDIAAGAKTGNAADLVTGTAGTTGQFAVWDGSGNVEGAAPPSWTYLTSIATTTGSSFSFTIPSGATEIELIWNGVKVALGADPIAMRIGGSSGVASTGYVGGNEGTSSTVGFIARKATAVSSRYFGIAKFLLTDESTDEWLCSWQISGVSDSSQEGGGVKVLSEEITTIQIITLGGGITFNAGELLCRYKTT